MTSTARACSGRDDEEAIAEAVHLDADLGLDCGSRDLVLIMTKKRGFVDERTPKPSQFNVILADCPWGYRNKKTGGSHTSGAVQKYPVLTVPELCALPVIKDFARDSVLFLWATSPMLPEALQVMQAWGYRYTSSLYWHKTGRYGTGYWFRGEVEQLLFGVRGHVPAFRTPFRNHLAVRPAGHSTKPEEFRALVEDATVSMGERRMLELFARRQTKGWTAWGLDLGQDLRHDADETEADRAGGESDRPGGGPEPGAPARGG